MSRQATVIEIIVLIVIGIVVVVLNRSGFNFDLRSRALGTPANIVIATKIKGAPFPTTFYHAFAQGGEESTDMLAPVASAVKALQPAFIRIDHLYDHYQVVKKENGQLTFDFSRLDRAVDTIRAVGATPVLSLSYMPAAIAKDGVITNAPNNWNDWSLVIQKTIEHFSGKSAKNLTGVYYEVWNEPDLAQFGKWGLSDSKNYLTLYEKAAAGAQAAQNVNQFFLGGPATTGLYKNWVTALLKTGSRIDFLSWHTYQTDPDYFAKDRTNIKDWLMAFPDKQNIKTLITEFGFTGDKDQRYGTTYAASYTAAVIRKLIDTPPTLAFTFELKDGPGGQNDGWGLLPHESVGTAPKPRYHLFSFLDDITGNMLAVKGEGTRVSAIATTRENVIRVLLVNFHPSGVHSENVPVTFTDLDLGAYTFRQQQLSGTDTTILVNVTQPTWQTTVFLPSHSVTLLTLEKRPAGN